MSYNMRFELANKDYLTLGTLSASQFGLDKTGSSCGNVYTNIKRIESDRGACQFDGGALYGQALLCSDKEGNLVAVMNCGGCDYELAKQNGLEAINWSGWDNAVANFHQ